MESTFDVDDKRADNEDRPSVSKNSLPKETTDSSTSTLRP